MEFATIQDIEDVGFTMIREDEGDGQGYQHVFARKSGNSWEYLIVQLSDDGYVNNVVGLKNGKVFGD